MSSMYFWIDRFDIGPDHTDRTGAPIHFGELRDGKLYRLGKCKSVSFQGLAEVKFAPELREKHLGLSVLL